MVVSAIMGSDPLSNNQVDLGLGNDTITYLPYGAQPPILKHPQALHLGMDKYSTGKGPSWFFQAVYDKLVIVPESDLTPSNSKRATNLRSRQGSEYAHQGVAQPGDYPWFCYWNNTFIEAFIYVNETSAAGSRPSSSSYPATSTTSTYPGGALPTPDPLPYYPKLVKIEERRISIGGNTIQPFCVKHYITGDGTPQTCTDASGQPVTMPLNETYPTIPPVMLRHHDPSDSSDDQDQDQYQRGDVRERQMSAYCGCLWLGR
jgi:hypothetical protein